MTDLFPPDIKDAIAEISRELQMRQRVYPNLIARGKLTQMAADRRNRDLDFARRLLVAQQQQMEDV